MGGKHRKLGEPRHTRHVFEHQSEAEYHATIVQDAILASTWLGEKPNRSLMGQDWVDFARSLKWTPGHRKALAEFLRDQLVQQCKESAEQARARLCSDARGLRDRAEAAGQYGPAVAALRAEADWILPKEPEKHLHLHAHSDVSVMSDEELIKLTTVDHDKRLESMIEAPDTAI